MCLIISLSNPQENIDATTLNIELDSDTTKENATIGSSVFSGCSKLKELIFPNIITKLDTTFEGKASLEKVVFQKGLEAIPKNMFSDCKNLKEFIVSLTVTSIGSQVFYNCINLETLTIKSITPPTIGSSAFANINTDLKIYVPSSLADTYKADANFSNFKDCVYPIE